MERILIVDDEAFIRENLERILGEDGYHPYSTDNGDDAVKEVGEADVDLVFLDLNLGAESGLGGALLEDFCMRMANHGFQVIRTHFYRRSFYLKRSFRVDKRWAGLVRFLENPSDDTTEL